jgi:ABC-type transport system involved in multi-copper enzyme maturation permease subunit
VNSGRLLFRLAWADFLERARRYSFLIALGLMIVVAYLFVPTPDASYVTIDLDGYRGVYNSAWIGAAVAMLASVYLALVGFYVVKGAVSRDRETGVGQIIATTPISKTFYLFGKWLSNLAVLTAMLVILILAAGVMQLVRGEVTQIEFWPLIAPFLFIALPTWAVVAALAVLFDTVRWLRGGFGNVAYFFAFIVFFIPVGQGFSGVLAAMEQGAVSAVAGHNGRSACCMILESNAVQLLGRELGPQDTFVWGGMTWAPASLIFPTVMVAVAISIVLLSVRSFKRFDPAYDQPRGGSGRLANLRGKVLTVAGLGKSQRTSEPEVALIEATDVSLTPLPRDTTRWRFGAVLLAELRMTFKGRPWSWYAVAAGLVVAALLVPLETAQNTLLPLAWVWPLLIWSSLGVREGRYQTEQYVFSTPRPLSRQLPATWLAGFIVAALAGAGVLVRLIAEGDGAGVLVWTVGALFIPSLALAFGTWTGSSKVFEIAYLMLWYIGPMQQIDQFNFMNFESEASQTNPTVWIFLFAAILLIALSAVGRARQVRR